MHAQIPFYEFLIGNSTNNFFHLLTKDERVKKRMKKGKIVDTLTEVANPKKSRILGKRKEGNV